jgi:carbamate kinase
MDNSAVTLVTQVEVDPSDAAFQVPSKPIGTFYTESQIQSITTAHPDWNMMKDSGRGYRRVVPSPMPQRIVERKAIETLVEAGYCVIAVGGGGIPVIKNPDGSLVGVNAVIDKDHASALLAIQLKADYFFISTAVDQVCLRYNQPNQLKLDHLSLKEVKTYIEAGEFAPGSMLPKVQAAMSFVENSGGIAYITSPECLVKAMQGKGGTRIVSE